VTYRVKIQEISVPAETAEQALRLVQASGTVPSAACTTSTARILGQLPGFESIPTVLFPNKLSEEFARLPGVQTRVLRENDSDDKALAIKRMQTDASQ
jgi:hypothetical protein